MTVTLVFPAYRAGASGGKNHRGALRFRELVDLPAPEALTHTALRAGKQLPEARQFSDRPYQRPFRRKEAGGAAGEAWEMRSLSGPQRAGRIALLSTIVLILGAAGVAGVAFRDRGNGIAGAAPAEARGQRQPGEPLIGEIEDTLRRFHAASTPEEKCAFIRGGRQLLPVLSAYYTQHGREEAFTAVVPDSMNSAEVAGVRVLYGLYETADGKLHQYALEAGANTLLLDWRSLTGWTGTGWRERLKERQSGNHTVCVSASLDTFFTSRHSDPAEWLCLRIEDLSRSGTAWAYVPRGGPAWQRLPLSFRSRLPGEPAPRPLRLLLTGSFTGSGSTPEFEVTDVEQGWFDRTLNSSPPSAQPVK